MSGRPPVHAGIGLGANLGDPVAAVRHAIRALGELPDSRLLAASRLYRTPAWGRTDQPDYINAAVLLETRLDPQALLAQLLDIERSAGRQRDGLRWGPRVLDLDLLLYGDERIDVDVLTVPHPRIAERAFVLVPLLEVSPQVVIPGIGPARDALAMIGTCGCEALG